MFLEPGPFACIIILILLIQHSRVDNISFIYRSNKMTQQDNYQLILTNQDYSKLQHNELENLKLLSENKTLKSDIQTLKLKIKDLTRSIYVRDSFIDYLVNQCDYTFANILNLDIVSCDITQSFYQDIVTHEQNGISSIELRDALQLYIQKNKRVFDRLNEIQQKFNNLNIKLKQFSQSKENNKQLKVVSQVPKKQNSKEQLSSQTEILKNEIDHLKEHRNQLQKQNESQIKKNALLMKQNDTLSKKIDTQSQKNYVIKLLIDQYYGQLEKNLIKIGGLTQREIGTVVGNQMKGIVQYINNLVKKATG